jgi:acetolactate synthase-1/2/3 large subunit
MQSALQIAQLPPSRPVYLEIPTDLLSATPEEGAEAETRDWEWSAGMEEADLEPALELLTQAERPLIWTGGGAMRAGAGEAVGELALKLPAPVMTTYQAAGLLGREHPCDVGLPPFVPEAGSLWDDADLVVAIGSDLDGTSTQNWAQPRPERLLAINVDAEDAMKNYRPDVVLVGDARVVTEALAAKLPDSAGVPALATHLERMRDAVWVRLDEEEPAATEFLRSVARALPDEAVVVCDMCIPGYWLGGFYRPPAPRRLLYPLGWGTLGCAFPQALGASLAGSGPTVSFSGDGGFLYAVGELATMSQEELPLTAVIVDDGGYGMLRYDQKVKGDPAYGVDLKTPDFETLVKTFGIDAQTVDGLGDEFGAALAQHVRDPKPSALITKAALDPPPNTSPRWYRRS